MPDQTLLEVRNLHAAYGRNTVVQDLSFQMGSEAVVLFGPSGCGKTTALKAILGIRERGLQRSGSVLLNGQPIPSGSGLVGMVFQGPILPGWLRLIDQCRLGAKISQLPKTQQDKRIQGLLERFGISHLAEQYPSSMSGGERQRAALVVALANEPAVLLLDEPTTFLDGVARQAIWMFLETSVREASIPRLIVSHDPDEAILLGDRIFVLEAPAKIIRTIDVAFPHPRSPRLMGTDEFWTLREELLDSQSSTSLLP